MSQVNALPTPPVRGTTGERPIDEVVRRVRRLYSESRSGMSLARYDIGVEVRRVMEDEARYGSNAVRRIASSIGRSVPGLYAYALLPAAWKRTDFVTLCARTSVRGVPLTLSHFLAMARYPIPMRERLLAHALETGAPVRALEREARKLVGGHSATSVVDRAALDRPAAIVLHRGLRAIARRLMELEVVAKRLPDADDVVAAVSELRRAGAEIEERIARAVRTSGEVAGASRLRVPAATN